MQNCPTNAPERICLHLSGTELKDKLQELTEELGTTVQFIKNINISICVMTTEHLNGEEEEEQQAQSPECDPQLLMKSRMSTGSWM